MYSSMSWKGNRTIEIGEEKVKVSADHIVDSPAKIPHCIYNESDKNGKNTCCKGTKTGGRNKICRENF